MESYRKIKFHCKNYPSDLSIQLSYTWIASTVHFVDVNKVSFDVAIRNDVSDLSQSFFVFFSFISISLEKLLCICQYRVEAAESYITMQLKWIFHIVWVNQKLHQLWRMLFNLLLNCKWILRTDCVPGVNFCWWSWTAEVFWNLIASVRNTDPFMCPP